ncbi:FAD-dependent oxidoreductase [Photobacterium sp. ZSDE20]|uniref:FAD-dependent oxidoreductase n=1 Tax=Photobacterium pectinilyticum TaxID=2906793 RepID=A0ABT1N7Z0_9GAMM|nr:FAD-dependent oxidoreductase [Photobacterium sp. ZSDE20]MCQ1060875.1 FAD-dependent oxidoreductase [Photobacterium sp. ZSDE20]MDD1828743.1 FAD-dependent oxidoreductase [Photobacterium sp. ZSDE20]
MDNTFDLIIIGAGPSGIAAAVTGSSLGLKILVVDEQPEPGGQIYRSMERSRPENIDILGKDYFAGKPLIEVFRASDVTYMPNTTVLNIASDFEVDLLTGGVVERVRGQRMLLCIGAVERPVPIKNWTLLGVMGAAAADILFKSANMVPTEPVVLAGSGPLMLLAACHLIDNGVEIAAMVETASIKDYIKAAPFLPKALFNLSYLFKGLQMRLKIKRAGVPLYIGCRDLEVVGDNQAEGLRFRYLGKQKDIAANTVLLHEGVVPNLRLSQSLNCEHQWYAPQRYFKPELDTWGQTSVAGVSIAGDSAGIGGGPIATAKGHLAALDCAQKLGKISEEVRDQLALEHRKNLNKELSIRPFLDHVFPPNPQLANPADDEILICRCEEITAGQVRMAIAQGARHPAQIKGKTRAGMGPCQGRMCAATISEMIADCCAIDIQEVGSLKIRTPLKPLSIEQYANMALSEKS